MKWDIAGMNEWKTDDFPLGAVIPESGNSRDYVTGGWRSNRPERNDEKCTQCLQCWIMCPDSAINTADEKVTTLPATAIERSRPHERASVSPHPGGRLQDKIATALLERA